MSGPAATGRPPGSRTRPRPVSCSICGVDQGDRQPILHFNLVRSVLVKDSTGRDAWRQRGAGAIDLCQRCWKAATRESAVRTRPPRPARTPPR